MSVTTSDLKSMMSRVRKPDAVAAPAALAKPPAPPSHLAPPPPHEGPPKPPPTAAPVPADAAPLQPAAVPVEAVTASEEVTEEAEESTDIGSILGEIMRDEELMTRILGILYRAKKKDPNGGAVAIMPMEKELGIARESATFVLNYMKTKHIIEADDKSRNIITVEGIDFLRARLSNK